jgi:hypothetical protein
LVDRNNMGGVHSPRSSLWHHYVLEFFFSPHNLLSRQMLTLTLLFWSSAPVNNFWWLRPAVNLFKCDRLVVTVVLTSVFILWCPRLHSCTCMSQYKK